MANQVDLSALKRQIEDAELVHGEVAANETWILKRVQVIESVINEIKSAHNTVVNQNKDEFNALVQKLQDELNDVYAAIDTKIDESIAAKESEIQDIIKKLGQLKDELSNIDVSVLETIDNIADIVAIEWLEAAQGLNFRRPLKASAKLEEVFVILREQVDYYAEDRYFAPDIKAASDLIKSGRLGVTLADITPA